MWSVIRKSRRMSMTCSLLAQSLTLAYHYNASPAIKSTCSPFSPLVPNQSSSSSVRLHSLFSSRIWIESTNDITRSIRCFSVQFQLPQFVRFAQNQTQCRRHKIPILYLISLSEKLPKLMRLSWDLSASVSISLWYFLAYLLNLTSFPFLSLIKISLSCRNWLVWV